MTDHSRYPRLQKLPASRQRGSILLISLVLILIAALLGVSAMQTSSIGTQLSANTRYHESAFRAAESAADQLLTVDNIATLVNNEDAEVTSSTSINENVSIEAEFSYLGKGAATGYSMGGDNGFYYLKYVGTAKARIASVESTSSVVQGVERLTFARTE